MGKGSLGCGGSCMKFLLFIFNLFFWLCGAALMGLGIWILVDDSINQYLKVITIDGEDPLLETAAIVLTSVGAFVFLVGFCGCCGACKENGCLLGLYATLVVVVIIAEIGAAILAIVFKTQLGDEVKDFMAETAKTNVKNVYVSPDPITAAWHLMQTELKCCGGESYLDYHSNTNFTMGNPVPLTCCVLSDENPTNPIPVNQTACYEDGKANTTTASAYLYRNGCYDTLMDWFDEYAFIIIGIGFGIAALQILGVVFACCLKREVDNSGYTT